MSFQQSVIGNLKSGIIGEIALLGPMRVTPAMLDSASAANNVVGRYFTYADEAAETMAAGGTGEIGGILILPKTHALHGTAGDTLGDALVLPNGEPGEFMSMGFVWVALASSGASIGSVLKYATATGVIDHGAPGENEAAVPNAKVVRHNPSPTAAGQYLALVQLTN